MDENLDEQLWADFQQAVSNKQVWSEDNLDLLLKYNPEEATTIHTFYRSLKTGTIDADRLLYNAAMLTVREDKKYLYYVGLALQNGANPNLNAEYPSPQEDGRPILIHIIAALWLRAAFTEQETLDAFFIQGKTVSSDISDEEYNAFQEESQRLLAICIAMLLLAGADLNMTVTTSRLLIEQGYDPTNFAIRYPSYLDSIRAFMILPSTPGREFWELNVERFDLYSYNRRDMSGVYQSRLLNSTSRKNLFMMALFLDHTPILRLPAVYEAKDILGLMFKYQARRSLLRLLAEWQDANLIFVPYSNPSEEGPIPEDEQASRVRELINLRLALKHFNEEMLAAMLEMGVQSKIFPSNFVTKVILDARYFHIIAPVQSQALNSMLVNMADYGVVFNEIHLKLIANYSPSTLKAIEDRFNIPIWKNACRPLQSENPAAMNSDILEIARQLNLPLGTKPQELCNLFIELSRLGPETLQERLLDRQLQMMRLQAPLFITKPVRSEQQTFDDQTLTVDEIQKMTMDNAERARQLQPVPQGDRLLFANSDTIKRPPEDYPEIDRVIYKSQGKYWFFTSSSYDDLLQSGRNPWINIDDDVYGEPIPEQVLLEIESKKDLIDKYGLSTEPGSITRGVKFLFAASPARMKEFHRRATIRELKTFLLMASEYNYEVSQFDDLSAEDIQELSERALSPELKLTVLEGSPNLALYDLANAALWQMITFSSSQKTMDAFEL